MTLTHAPHPATVDRGSRHLAWAATVFATAVLLHNGDHLRRGGDSVSADVFWIGSAAMILEVAVVALVLARHRTAPLAAAATGLSLAAGYLVVHFTPDRGWLSDSLIEGGASALSIGAALLEVAAAVALGVVGVAVLRGRGGLASATGAAPPGSVALGAVLVHPVVAAMIVGNLVVLAGSLATR